MTYKDLNVYQRAYQVAIELHQFLEKDGDSLSADEINALKGMSRDILGNIAESFSQRTSRAKRYFNFKALDIIRHMMMDLDFFYDVQRLPEDAYHQLYDEYEICAKMLYKMNKAILTKETQNQEEKEAVAA